MATTKPIRDLGTPVTPVGTELILIDNGVSMKTATINDAVNPKASALITANNAVYDPQNLAKDAFARANHTGTQSADTITDGTTNKAYTGTEQTKLAGIEAAADVTDATNVAAAGAVMTSATDASSFGFVAGKAATPADTSKVLPTVERMDGVAPAITANTMLVDNAGGTAREAKDFPTIVRLLSVKAVKYGPEKFGGAGDGTTDDTTALANLAGTVRADMAAGKAVTVDLTGGAAGIWRTLSPVNLTGISAYSDALLTIQGGTVKGECTGKPIFDMVGSRDYMLSGVSFVGSQTSMPVCAIQAARSTADGACDLAAYVKCASSGYFSRAAFHVYGQETTSHFGCTWYNSQYDARAAIFEGVDNNPMTSDYTTVMTGGTAFSNWNLFGTSFQILPDRTGAITGVTNASAGVFTVVGHAFQVGDSVVFYEVGGMPTLSSLKGSVTSITTDTITTDIDTTSLGTFTSGGTIIRAQTQPTIAISRAIGVHAAGCYAVGWGQPQIEMGFGDLTKETQIGLDFLLEGSAVGANVIFLLNGAGRLIEGFDLKLYRSNAVGSTLYIDTTGGGSLALHGGSIKSYDNLWSPKLVNAPASFAYSGEIIFKNIADVQYASMFAFDGVIQDIATGAWSSKMTAL